MMASKITNVPNRPLSAPKVSKSPLRDSQTKSGSTSQAVK